MKQPELTEKRLKTEVNSWPPDAQLGTPPLKSLQWCLIPYVLPIPTPPDSTSERNKPIKLFWGNEIKVNLRGWSSFLNPELPLQEEHPKFGHVQLQQQCLLSSSRALAALSLPTVNPNGHCCVSRITVNGCFT